jgi:N-acetylglutamate synthase-like GNAT family acetyltransferase
MQVRVATLDDLDDVEQILDAAALETDRERTRASIRARETVVAVEGGRLLGAAVCIPEASGVRIDAIAVRKRRQAQGLGTALVERIVEDHERVVAAFDERVRPFYASLGFEIEPIEDEDRYRGRYRRE